MSAVETDVTAALPVRKIQRYGWRPDSPDPRDHLFAPDPKLLATPPVKFSLRTKMPKVYDQGQLGSCTGNAIAGAVQYQQKVQSEAEGAQNPSRLFIYYNERVIEGTVASDAGAEIRDGMKVVAKLGAPPESDWPYDISKFAQKPPAQAYTDALKYEALSYSRVSQTTSSIMATLAAGNPIVYGFTVYDSFESAEVAATGMVPMPKPGEPILGGHAVLAVGYDTTKVPGQTLVEVRNSWGTRWGVKGYFWVPIQYLTDYTLSSDFWTIKTES